MRFACIALCPMCFLSFVSARRKGNKEEQAEACRQQQKSNDGNLSKSQKQTLPKNTRERARKKYHDSTSRPFTRKPAPDDNHEVEHIPAWGGGVTRAWKRKLITIKQSHQVPPFSQSLLAAGTGTYLLTSALAPNRYVLAPEYTFTCTYP